MSDSLWLRSSTLLQAANELLTQAESVGGSPWDYSYQVMFEKCDDVDGLTHRNPT